MKMITILSRGYSKIVDGIIQNYSKDKDKDKIEKLDIISTKIDFSMIIQISLNKNRKRN